MCAVKLLRKRLLYNKTPFVRDREHEPGAAATLDASNGRTPACSAHQRSREREAAALCPGAR